MLLKYEFLNKTKKLAKAAIMLPAQISFKKLQIKYEKNEFFSFIFGLIKKVFKQYVIIPNTIIVIQQNNSFFVCCLLV